MNTNLKQKKKNDSDFNFYNFSLLVPYPNKFLVVCICIVIFHGIYSPLTTNIFFCGGIIFFSVPCSQGLRIFQISWGPSVFGGSNFLFERGARPFSSIKPSMTTHVNSRTVDGKIIYFIVHANFSHFYFGIFSLRIFLSVQVSIETLKKVLTAVRY